jgi:hypothetical protein
MWYIWVDVCNNSMCVLFVWNKVWIKNPAFPPQGADLIITRIGFCRNCVSPRPLPYPGVAFYLCRSIYVWLRPERRSIRCRGQPPLLMGDDDDHYAPVQAPPQRASEDDVLLQSMDESGRGPRRAVAEAVASPLGVQPSINSAGISSSK